MFQNWHFSCNPQQRKRSAAMETEIKPGAIQYLKPKIVVIMGATGAGKSKLAIDLASRFPIEIINADSMQVYQGLDVLTNKVPLEEKKGVPHHLVGTISPTVEFTAKDFRDSAIPLIEEIWSRNCLPVVVGGTNYYIQALVTQFLLDDFVDDIEESCLSDLPGESNKLDFESEPTGEDLDYTYARLKDVDPDAANRLHPNDHRKIKQYLKLYARSGALPSKLFKDNVMENWGRADNLRYDCCFICVDASLPALDNYVDRRVDLMVDAGLLEEVYDIFELNSDYTRGLRQAIGVREFEEFLIYWNSEHPDSSARKDHFIDKMHEIRASLSDNQPKVMLEEAINMVKLNTRRLLRRQRRRLSRLQLLYGWNIQYVDVTSCLSDATDELWAANVVEPSVGIVKSFLDTTHSPEKANGSGEEMKLSQRDLWTLHVCQACGNKELRGAHEWEQHKQGKTHRKRVSSLKKSGISLGLTQKTGTN